MPSSYQSTEWVLWLSLQNACSQPVNSCLSNQLKDLADGDDARIKRGDTPLYYVSRWGGGRTGAKQVRWSHTVESLADHLGLDLAALIEG